MYWRHQRLGWKTRKENKKMVEISHFTWKNKSSLNQLPACFLWSEGNNELLLSCWVSWQWLTLSVSKLSSISSELDYTMGFSFSPPFFFFPQYTCNVNRHVNHLTFTCFLIKFYSFNYEFSNHTASQGGKCSNPQSDLKFYSTKFLRFAFLSVKSKVKPFVPFHRILA